MGWLRKKCKQIASAFRKVGRRLKKGLGKIAKAFGKLGPLGSIALSFILPGLGGIAGWLGKTVSALGPAGQFLVDISTSIYNAASGAFKYVKGKISSGLGKVFNTVTGAIENGMNTVSSAFGGKGQIGSSFRNFVSDLTGGFIEKSETGLALETEQFESTLQDAIAENTKNFDGSSYIEKDGTFTFYDKEGEVIETLTSPDAKRYMELTDGDTLFDEDYGTKPTTQPKGKSSIASTIQDKDLSFKEKIKTSREYAAYKPIEATRMAGATLNEADAAMEAQINYAKARKSDYFKTQASYQLAPLEEQNYSRVMDMPMFVDYSNFNVMEDPAKQYLSYRGITDYINPMDIGGYGFDYQQFLQAQLARA